MYQRFDPWIAGPGRRPIRSRMRCPEIQSHGPWFQGERHSLFPRAQEHKRLSSPQAPPPTLVHHYTTPSSWASFPLMNYSLDFVLWDFFTSSKTCNQPQSCIFSEEICFIHHQVHGVYSQLLVYKTNSDSAKGGWSGRSCNRIQGEAVGCKSTTIRNLLSQQSGEGDEESAEKDLLVPKGFDIAASGHF